MNKEREIVLLRAAIIGSDFSIAAPLSSNERSTSAKTRGTRSTSLFPRFWSAETLFEADARGQRQREVRSRAPQAHADHDRHQIESTVVESEVAASCRAC